MLVLLSGRKAISGSIFGEYLKVIEGSYWDHFYDLIGMYDCETLSLGSWDCGHFPFIKLLGLSVDRVRYSSLQSLPRKVVKPGWDSLLGRNFLQKAQRFSSVAFCRGRDCLVRMINNTNDMFVKDVLLLYYRNLVDPASSHMLVLKIKPCMSKYK